MPGNHVLLETINLTQNAASVTFDNIPQSGYSDLKIVVSSRTDISTTLGFFGIYLNGNASSSYKTLYGYYSGAGSDTGTVAYGYTSGNGATSNVFGVAEIKIPDYLSSNPKVISIESAGESNASTGPQMAILNAGYTGVTTAVTSVTILATDSGIVANKNFLANSTFSLYGIAAKNTTPAVSPKATGGNIVANDGTYWYHAFLSSGTFTPQTSLTCDILQVAGGGGAFVGGAGAGGLLIHSSQSLTTQNYACAVGAGGRAGIGGNTSTNGNNSQFAALTASVGGGRADNQTGYSGGSGAGYNSGSGTAGSGTSGQGFAGGAGANGNSAGGGGGAGGAGNNAASGQQGGAGGIGFTSSLTNGIGAATRLGVLSSSNYYFAGGGGGYGNTTGASGGLGGGGNGGNETSVDATSGLANTGGGGGGAGGPRVQGAGGSGVIVIRYAM